MWAVCHTCDHTMYEDTFLCSQFESHSFLQILLTFFYCFLCHVCFVSVSHSLWLILSLILLQLFHLSQAFCYCQYNFLTFFRHFTSDPNVGSHFYLTDARLVYVWQHVPLEILLFCVFCGMCHGSASYIVCVKQQTLLKGLISRIWVLVETYSSSIPPHSSLLLKKYPYRHPPSLYLVFLYQCVTM